MRAGRIVAISCRRVCRSYSSVSSKIGARFVSAKEIDSYLSKVSWNIQDYVPTRVDKRLLPAKETVIRLLRISGLPERDLGPVQRRLANQLSFIDHLHSLPVDESINANHARILHRNPEPLNYDTLIASVRSQTKDVALGEKSGSWDAVKEAKLSKDGFFILREGLLKNRS